MPLDPTLATPPIAEKRPVTTTIHGRTIVDEYAWLRDRDDPATMAYLDAENAYAEAVMAPYAELRDALYDEMLSHIKQTDLSVPYRLGDFEYWSRTEEGLQYPFLMRKRHSIEDGAEETVLDLNALAEGKPYLGLGAYEISDDGNLLAYSVDFTGYRQYELRVKDLRSGVLLPERVERVGSVSWSTDGATLYFTTEDDVSKRHDSFWRLHLGEPVPTRLYFEEDDRFDVGSTRTNDRTHVLLGSYSKATTEWRALRADVRNAELHVLEPRVDDHRYSVEHHGDRWLIVTNLDAVENRLVWAPEATPGREHWTTLVPERDGVHLESVEPFRHFAILSERRDAYSDIEIFDLATNELRTIAMPEDVHTVDAQQNPEFATDTYRFAYTSLVTPKTVIELDMRDGSRTTLKQTDVPGYDPGAYVSEKLIATARDGTRVPISVVRRRDAPSGGPAPMLLYGYGSYGISIDPTFSPTRLVLLDRGVTFAIAHIRGGGELGERWRTAGHLQRKITTFEDFADCAKFLIAEGLTASDRLAIQGGSAGGLLVAATVNAEPELFRAAIAQVPFVDVINTMLDETLPLTTAEYLEWGDPRDERDFEYLTRYSPYENVTAARCPAMLVKVSLNDSQVPYWEGAKLVARYRSLSRSESVFLVTNMGAGHGGASGRYDHLREIAFDFAFSISSLSIISDLHDALGSPSHGQKETN